MKLHLPKMLRIALLAAITMAGQKVYASNTTTAWVNFGGSGNQVTEEGKYWNNVTGDNAAALSGVYNLIDYNTNVATGFKLFFTATANPWQSSSDTSTVFGAMQKGYLDYQFYENPWSFVLVADDVSATGITLNFYLSGDNASPNAPITVNGVNYINGTNVTGDTGWGNRNTAATSPQGEHNTVTVTGINSLVTATPKQMESNDAGRATISGISITWDGSTASSSVLTLNSGVNEAASHLEGVSTADRIFSLTGADDDTSSFYIADGEALSTIEAAANTVTLTSPGTITLNRLSTKEGATLNIGAGTTVSSGNMVVTGDGTIGVSGTLVTGLNYIITGEDSIVIKDGGVLDLTASDNRTNYNELVAINNNTAIKTEQGGFVKVAFNNTTSSEIMMDGNITLKHNIEAQGAVLFHGRGSVRAVEVGEGVAFKVMGDTPNDTSYEHVKGLSIIQHAVLNITGGSVEASEISLGHGDGSSDYKGTVNMTAGSLKTGTVYLRQNHPNVFNVTGGTLEFTAENALNRLSPTNNRGAQTYNTASNITIKGADANNRVTLKATTTDWTLDGEGLTTAPVIGNVTIDAANTHNITISNAALSGSIVNNKELALGAGIGVAEGDTATITNNGELVILNTLSTTGALTLDGVIKIGAFQEFTEAQAGTQTWSDAENAQGFRIISGAEYYLSRGGINYADYDTTNMSITDVDGNNYQVTFDGSDAIFNGGTYTTTVYEVKDGYTTAVTYNGADGGTATATGFLLGNKTLLHLTGTDNSALTDKIVIAAGDGGKATVAIANRQTQTYESLGITNLVQVQSGSYVLGITGENTIVTTDRYDHSTAFHTGEISITDGGRLQLNDIDALGWGKSGTPTAKLTIENGTLAMGGRQTWGCNLELKGGAVIKATDTLSSHINGQASNNPGIDIFKTDLDWKVSGTGNIFEDTVGLRLRDSLSIDIAQGGELSLQGIMVNNGHVGSATLTKTGAGTLILDGEAKTLDNKFIVSNGTLQLGTEITLKKALEVNGTGELEVTDDGKVYLGSGLTQVGEVVEPADGVNGWSLANVCFATSSGSGSLGERTTVYWGGGQESEVTSSVDSATGVTTYLAGMGVDYYVQDASQKAVYSAATGLTNAGTIYMSDGTTLVVEENLNHYTDVVVAENAKVNYEVDGATLTLTGEGPSESVVINNIESIALRNEATLSLHHPFLHKLGSAEDKVQISMSGNSLISLRNGNSWGTRELWADILVDGDARIGGSGNGNASTVCGTISGNGTLTLTQAVSTNSYNIASTIADGANAGDAMAVKVDALGGNSGFRVYVNGANTYTGGTTINNGTLIVNNEKALGEGAVTMAGGALQLDSNLTIGGALTKTGGELSLGGHTLTLGNGTDTLTHSIDSIASSGTIAIAAKSTLNAVTTLAEGVTIALAGSGVFNGGAAMPPAGLTVADDWTGTYKITGVTGNLNNLKNVDNVCNANSTVVLESVEAYLGGAEVTANLVLKNGTTTPALTINNGSSSSNGAFSGKITGDGDIRYTWTAGGGYSGHMFWKTVDTSEWKGWFISGSENTTKEVRVMFMASGNVFDESGLGGVKDDRTGDSKLVVTVGDNAESNITFNGTIQNAKSLTVKGTAEFKQDITSAAMAVEAGASASLASGKEVTIAGDITGAGTLTNQGTLSAANISVGSFSSTGGSIELTGTLSSANISISGTTLKGTWSATGAVMDEGVVVATDANLTLTGATLKAALTNNGTLTLAGTTTLGMAGEELETTYTDGLDSANGYKNSRTAYQILTGSAGLIFASDHAWSINGNTPTSTAYDNTTGKLETTFTDYSTYWVRSGEISAGIDTESPTTGFALDGGKLKLDAALNAKYTAGIVAYQNGTVILGAAGELNSNSVHIADGVTAKVTLQGSGTYIMDTTTLPSVTGLTDATWTGTVVLSADGTGINLGNLGNSGSTIELAGAAGSLADGTVTVASAIELKGSDALTITGGSGKVTFSGAVTDSGTTDSGTIKSTGGTQHIEFTGDISGWTGAYVNNNGAATTVTIGADTTLNAALSDTAEVKKLEVNFASGKTVAVAADITAASLNNYATTTFETGKTLDVDTLTNDGSLSLSQDTLSLSSLTGTGSITAKSLTLQGAMNNMGSITAGNLILGTEQSASALTLTGKLDITGKLTYNSLSTVTAASLGASGLDLSISDDLLLGLSTDSEKKSIALLTLKTKPTELEGIVKVNGDACSKNGKVDIKTGIEQFSYELNYNATTGTFTLSSKMAGEYWDDYEGNRWNQASLEADDFKKDPIPATGVAATDKNDNLIIDGVENPYIIVNGSVETNFLTIDIWDASSVNPIFCGGTDTIETTVDTVNVAQDVSLSGNKFVMIGASADFTPTDVDGPYANEQLVFNVGNNVNIYKGSRLLVSENGNLTVGNNVTVKGQMQSIGTVHVEGDVSIAEDSYFLSGLFAFNETEYGIGTAANSMTIKGNVTNEGSLRHYIGNLSIAKVTQNTGTIEIQGGSAELGTLTNTGTINVKGGSLSTGVVTNDGGNITIGGAKDTEGNITAHMTVDGDLDNTNGTITIGSVAIADDPATEGINESADATYGSLTVTGNLTGTGSGANLTVEKDSALNVGGDLEAGNINLGFNGNVTVGGDASAKNLSIAEGASFTAANATITGVVSNNGSLSVGTKQTDAEGNEVLTGGDLTIGTLTGEGDVHVGTGGKLTIDTLSGEGDVHVGKDGELSIKDDTGFHGVLDNKGTVVASGTLTLHEQTANGGNLQAAELVITKEANGSTATSLKTNSIVIQEMTEDPVLTLESLSAATTGGTIQMTLSQMGNKEGIDGIIAEVEASEAGGISYHLLSITGGGVSEDMLALTHNDDLHQYLLKQGYTHSGLASTSTFARSSQTNVYIGFWKQDIDEATWNTAGNTTEAGLVLGTLTNGTMVLKSNDMLDNVQRVNVTTATTLDLSTTGDTAAVNINGLTGAANLTVKGNGDTVNIKTDDYTGRLDLTSDLTAVLDNASATVYAKGSEVTVSGTMEDGILLVKQTDTAQGDVKLVDSELRVIIAKDSTVLSNEVVSNLIETGVAKLGSASSSDPGNVAIGTYDEATNTWVQSFAYDKYFANIRLEDGVVKADRNTSYYTDGADASVSDNGKAGLAMADKVLVELNPQADKTPGALAGVLDVLENPTTSADKADELGASLAGAATAVLGMAVAGDVDRQLQAIRNRTTTMGVDQSVANEDMPYFNAWINAEGDRAELNHSGTEGGYELSSWGGTVGFDVDFCPTFTAGLAMTAMYGDLDVTGADKATGDLDTYYLSAFARYAASAWTHTFVATVGMSDISLDRTVNGNELEGETDGLSFGLMYEVGRVIALDEDATACLQPVFNVTWKHSTVDGYTEKGGELALEVDEQTMDTVTFGLGTRLQAVVGESMYNRTSILEARVLAKADVGDRSGSSDATLAALKEAKGSTDSAEMGAFGLEAGAGLTVPLGQDGGSIFMDASVELRSDYTNVNGTVGYRMNF